MRSWDTKASMLDKAVWSVRERKGGTGGLVKCFVERIVEDRTAGDLRCPRCGNVFARAGEIAGRPIHKIVQGKVFTRGMRRK